MRSVWTGAMALSLLNMPMKLGNTVKDNDLGLKLVRKSDGKAVKFTRVAEGTTEEVPWSDTAKGYTAPDGSLVILTREDFEKAYGPKNRTAEVVMFTDASNIPPMAVKSSYWVQPDTGGEKTYALLASTLRQTNTVAVVTFAMRDRQSVAVLRPHDGYLSLETLEWDADIVRPDFAAPPQTATKAEQDLALTLVRSMTGKFDHANSVDKSAEAVMAVISAKIETGQVISPPARPDGAGVTPIDLAASLRAAVAAQKGKTQTAPRKRATREKVA